MRRLVLATVVLFPCTALADVRPSGDARFGLRYDSGAAVTTRIEKRFTLNFDGTTRTDGGVTLGGRVRIRSEANAASGLSGARVFARFGGLTVGAGNFDGAIEKMPGILADGIGLTGLGKHGVIFNVAETAERDRHADWDTFSSTGNGAEGIELIGAVGDASFHVSYSSNGLRGLAGPRYRLAAHGAYNFGAVTLAIGGQSSDLDSEQKLGATLAGRFSGTDVAIGYAVNGGGTARRIDKVALTVGRGFGPWRLDGYVAHQGFSDAVVTTPTTWGLGGAYALGGGASIRGGVEGTTVGTVRADIGVTFNF